MKQYDVILFDVDGTLTNSFEGIANGIRHALAAFGKSEPSDDVLRSLMGPPLHYTFYEHYHFTEEDAQAAIKKYREYFSKTGVYENELYDGVIPMLKSLHDAGKTLITASSKPERFVKIVLDYFDMSRYFSVITGALMDGVRNEKDEVIAYALELGGITDKSRVLMVGDRNYDVIGARKMGLDTLGVTYGFGGRQELIECGAAYLADSPEAVTKLILG